MWTREIQKHVRVDPDTGELLYAENDFAAMAEEFMTAARGQGIELTGPNGLLTGLTRQVLQTALKVEMADHLGYGKHGPENGADRGWRGDRPNLEGRAGTSAPAAVSKYSRRLAGFDGAVISLYAKGMTTGDIVNHLADVYGDEVSRDLVSKVTDQILTDMIDWQSRPLDPVYPVVLIDAIVLKVPSGPAGNRPVGPPDGSNETRPKVRGRTCWLAAFAMRKVG